MNVAYTAHRIRPQFASIRQPCTMFKSEGDLPSPYIAVLTNEDEATDLATALATS
jgi:hypothetical protein